MGDQLRKLISERYMYGPSEQYIVCSKCKAKPRVMSNHNIAEDVMKSIKNCKKCKSGEYKRCIRRYRRFADVAVNTQDNKHRCRCNRGVKREYAEECPDTFTRIKRKRLNYMTSPLAV